MLYQQWTISLEVPCLAALMARHPAAFSFPAPFPFGLVGDSCSTAGTYAVTITALVPRLSALVAACPCRMAWRRLLLLLLLLLAAAIVAPSFVIVPAATTATACPFS